MGDFKLKKAERRNVPLLVGLMGPSGSGKTYSALRLATGIQRVTGGRVAYIDTEADRALHYADEFDFDHMPFGEPFKPSRYLEAIRACVKTGAKVIVVDSMSHEHEGPGGVLDWHDAEVKRMGGERHNFRAWAAPKADRRRLINGLLQLRCNFIFCFRAKEKTKPKKQGNDLDHMGFMAIAGDEFVYEMTASALLMPNAGGVPTWNPEREGERAMVKQPAQFRELFSAHRGKPLSEDIGEALARWAAGGSGGEAHKTGVDSPRIPKGPHKGKTVRELHSDYLASEIERREPDDPWRKRFEAEIDRRIAEGETD